MNTSGIRRNFKNIVHNYSDAQVKVREATSNDPWGPSSTVMSEIADLTYNVVAFSEIMQMIWKRLNDHGKNWRHVYKALVLLEYLIKTGTEKVAQQCKENIFAIQTLKDFQYIEENKDQGMNVREKAKQLVSLLKDDERLKNERARALKAKERFAQATSGIGSDMGFTAGGGYRSDSYTGSASGAGSPQEGNPLPTDLESARPQTAGEEELQLQLALAMSKEEADQEEQRRRSDDVRLQMAITQSQEDFRVVQSPGHSSSALYLEGQTSPPRAQLKVQEETPASQSSALLDLLDIGMASPGQDSSNAAQKSRTPVTDPWGMPFNQRGKQQVSGPWGSPLGNRAASTSPVPSDPWAPKPDSRSATPIPGVAMTSPMRTAQPSMPVQTDSQTDPWNPVPPNASASAADPWGPSSGAFGSTPALATNGDVDGFDLLSSRAQPSKSTNNLDHVGGSCSPFDGTQQNGTRTTSTTMKKTPESFLGENSALVNLDALVSSKPPDQTAGTTNPFAVAGAGAGPGPGPGPGPNPFQAIQQQQRVSINELRQQQFPPAAVTLGYSMNLASQLPTPLLPAGQTATLGGPPGTNNPFL